MTGSLRTKKSSSGKEYYYVHLSYKDPHTQKWKTKDIKTEYDVKGNKRKAEGLIPGYVKKYSYLERLSTSSDGIDPEIELCDYMESWLERKASSIRSNTYDSYKYRMVAIKRYFAPRHTLMRDVTPRILNDFYNYCLIYGKADKKSRDPHPLSVRSVRSLKSILFAVFNEAVINGVVTSNPVRDTKVSNKRNRDFSEEMFFLTEDEIREMLVFLDKNYPYLKAIAFMGVFYGLRREEILGLKWSAIDFQRKTIVIRHTVTGNRTIYAEDKTKTKSGYRTLDLFPTAEACLNVLKKEQEKNRAFFGNSYQDTKNYVFTHEDGTPYRPDYITKYFSKAMDEFGRPELTLHKLRHTCVSLLIDKGWDIKKIQYWIGDDDAATVMNIYAQYTKLKSNLAVDDLSEMSASVADLFE